MFKQLKNKLWKNKNFHSINIDKIYCINLKRAECRWARCAEFYKKFDLNVERFEGFDWKTNLIKPHSWELNGGHLGCALSHYTIWLDFINSNYEYVCILEDDAIPIRKLSPYSSSLNFDILYLNERIQSDENGIVFNGIGLESYIISKKGATKMVKICSDLNHPIDLRLQSHMRYFENLKQFRSIHSDNLTAYKFETFFNDDDRCSFING